MDFNPDTWGTVAEWVGGVGTTAAFIATFVVILRDAKQRRRQQARKIAFYVEDQLLADLRGGGTVTYSNFTVANLSDEPIYDVRILAEPRGEYRNNVRSVRHLQPGDKLAYSVEWSTNALLAPALFRDNSGRRWHRDSRGELHELGLLRRKLWTQSMKISRSEQSEIFAD
ncbi:MULTISPECIES: hypothetical protein [unclassified Arthrobacter]|uniref:hypothetical protein n=1 Tax=unclassified Arthrobacter TaxID=235627 RepID=UPI0028831E43|nr:MULTISPECIES: hypothetical protein [unclassified Arthrobacter]